MSLDIVKKHLLKSFTVTAKIQVKIRNSFNILNCDHLCKNRLSPCAITVVVRNISFVVPTVVFRDGTIQEGDALMRHIKNIKISRYIAIFIKLSDQI